MVWSHVTSIGGTGKTGVSKLRGCVQELMTWPVQWPQFPSKNVWLCCWFPSHCSVTVSWTALDGQTQRLGPQVQNISVVPCGANRKRKKATTFSEILTSWKLIFKNPLFKIIVNTIRKAIVNQYLLRHLYEGWSILLQQIYLVVPGAGGKRVGSST